MLIWYHYRSGYLWVRPPWDSGCAPPPQLSCIGWDIGPVALLAFPSVSNPLIIVANIYIVLKIPSNWKTNRMKWLIAPDTINQTCQIYHRKTLWHPIDKIIWEPGLRKEKNASSSTYHVTCAQCSGVNLDLFSLTASVSIIFHSTKNRIYNCHRPPDNVQRISAKVQSISLREYIFIGEFLGSEFFICIASAFVLVLWGYFTAYYFLTSSSTYQAPYGRTTSGVMPVSAI